MFLTAPHAVGQTTQPAEPAKTRILLLPFEQLSGDPAIATALTRSVEMDLSRKGNYETVLSEKPATDAAAANELGKRQEYQFVVRGTVQTTDDRVRISGEVLDVAQAKAAGTFKITGPLHEIFELQDLVAEQVRKRLPRTETRETAERAEVPGYQPLGGRDNDDRRFDPDWLHPSNAMRDDGVTWRYNYGYPPYGFTPYGFSYGYGLGWSPYAYGYYPSRIYRPLYGDRYADYTYRGVPDRHAYYRSFSGPVPQRWYRNR